MRPVIMIAPDDGFNPMFKAPHAIISNNYTKCVMNAGGLPVVALDLPCWKEYVEMADALLITGGDSDIHAGNYGRYYGDGMMSPGHPLNEYRDDMDFSLLKGFMEAGKPVFAIGRGLEVLNVAMGGSLYMDLANEAGIEHKEGEKHTIIAEEGSFAAVYAADAKVVSKHHQGIKELGKDLKVVAKAPDGVIEAIEHTSLPVYAVLWHPEQTQTEADQALFNRLVELCKGGDR
ncbi:MAG: gamma-glutamyl-gamma-aminobutyrate hydrolase family protein [Oscillospiraceae bacterium]|nr:gamma-glutamyl-gamma-aminobutyrate hydrolase family protein [Oscillospiraceae bacterium]